jgi:hypothetical protein
MEQVKSVSLVDLDTVEQAIKQGWHKPRDILGRPYSVVDEIVLDMAAELRVARPVVEKAPPAERLRMLADWLDLYDDFRDYEGRREVQADLRAWADARATYDQHDPPPTHEEQ